MVRKLPCWTVTMWGQTRNASYLVSCQFTEFKVNSLTWMELFGKLTTKAQRMEFLFRCIRGNELWNVLQISQEPSASS